MHQLGAWGSARISQLGTKGRLVHTARNWATTVAGWYKVSAMTLWLLS